MNDFNPFETLGIDPNQDRPKTAPIDGATERNDVMGTMGQFNPFKTLGINPNEGTDYNVVQKNGKDMEVSSMLGIQDFEPMTDNDKQSYVDALSDEDWNTWNQLKSEGYSFEARKALMENQDMLYDINEEGTGKYYQTHQSQFINSLTDLKQKQLDFYQEKISGWSDKAAEEINKFINYEQKGIGLYADEYVEKEPYTGQKFLNVAGSIISKILSGVEHLTNLAIHQQVGIYNTAINMLNPTYEKVSWDAKNENYESKIAAAIGLGNDVLGTYFAVEYPIATTAFGIITQSDGFIGQGLNWVDTKLTNLVNKVFDIPLMQEWIQQPGNAGIEEDLTEGITQGIYLLLIAKSKKAFGRTKAGMKLNEIRGKVNEGVKNSIRRGKEAGDWMKGEMKEAGEVTSEGEYTDIAKENISNATKQGIKYGRKEIWNKKPVESKPTELGLPEDKTSITPKDGMVNPTEGGPTIITPETTEVTEKPTENKSIVKTNDKLTQLAKDTKLSENTITNLESNPDLQTEFQNTIKPYLEENGKNNPEGVITEPVNSLVYDIRSGIDELRTQQANLNRSINNKKLSPMEKALIKEIEKIIDQKEPKQVLKSLGKLTPAQQGLMQRIVPNLDSRVQTINQMLELTKEITKGNLLSRFLKFQAERPRKGITGFAKKLLYDYVKDLYDQRGIQSSTESIDKFIDSLSDQQQSDIVETLYKKKTGGKLNKKDSYALIKMTEELKTKLNEVGYMPSTWKHVTNAEGKPYNVEMIGGKIPKKVEVLQTLKQALDTKFPGRNETVGEYLERKGVPISVAESSEIMRWIGDMDAETAQALYFPFYDRILTLSTTPYEFFLLHEYGHRVMFQLGTFEIMEHLAWIAKRDHITEKQAVERFAEFQRNYLQYGNLDGKDAETVLVKEYGSEFGKDLSDVMEKERKKIVDLFEIPEGDKKLIDLFEHIKNDTEVGQEITSRQPQALEGGPGKTKRISWLQQNIDPNIQTIEFNDFGSLTIRFKDGSTKLRSDYKKGLTKDQLLKVDTYKKDLVDIIMDDTEIGFKGEGKFDYKTATNEKSLTTIKLKEFIEKNNEKVSLEQTENYPMKLSSAVDSEGNALSDGMNNYMKDSQVRDKNGNLILVRHGTNKNFNEWDKSKVGGRTLNEGYFGKGLYFTDDPSIAKNYSEGGHGGDLNPHIEEGYLNITKMFDWNKGYTKEEFKDFLSDLGLSQDKIAHYTSPHNDKIYLLNGYDLNYMKDLPDANWNEAGYKNLVYGDETLDLSQLTDQLIDAGYDGAYGDNGEYNEYVIYEDSNQFKRKTNENPTWSDNFSKMEIGEQQQNPLIKSLIDQSIKQDVSGIRMREDGLIVGKYHGHKEMPVKAIMENFDELKLEPEIKKLLEKQYEIWEQEEFDKTLQNIK